MPEPLDRLTCFAVKTQDKTFNKLIKNDQSTSQENMKVEVDNKFSPGSISHDHRNVLAAEAVHATRWEPPSDDLSTLDRVTHFFFLFS